MATVNVDTLSKDVEEVGKLIERLSLDSKKQNTNLEVPEQKEMENKIEEIILEKINENVNNENQNNERKSKISYKPLVVVGPSGVGKGTLLEYLTKRFNNLFNRAISHTTRNKRQHELDGVHYYFIDKDNFENKIKENHFLEHANIHGNMYGTSFQSIKDVENKKQICILEKDFQGALAIRKANIDANYVFITCNGQIETLRQRLKGRQTENDEQINNRLKTAEIEFDFLNKNLSLFDCVLSNDDLITAQNEFVNILKKWYPCISSHQ